jgi:hypothetical protein
MIPCYHISKIKFGSVKKKIETNLWVFTRCVFMHLKIFKTKFGILKEKRKRQNMNSIRKRQKHKCHYSHTNLSFLFLFMYFYLVLKHLRIANTHLVNTHNFCSTFLESCNLNFEQWYNGSN